MLPHLWWLPQFGDAEDGDVVVLPDHVFVDEPPLFCDPIYSDPYKGKVPEWYGGGWRTKLPVTYLGTPDLDQFARSLDCDPANTQARCNFQKVRRIKAIVIPRSNCTSSAEVQVTLALTDGALTGAFAHESPWLKPWPEWLTEDDAYGRPVPFVYFVDDALVGVDAQYLLIKWKDEDNPDGALEIPRALATGVYVFPENMSVGASAPVVDNTQKWKSDGNTNQFDIQPPARSDSFEISYVEEREAFTTLQEMELRLGLAGQVYFCFGQHDPLMPFRSYLATRVPGPTQWASSNSLKKSFVIEEVL